MLFRRVWAFALICVQVCALVTWATPVRKPSAAADLPPNVRRYLRKYMNLLINYSGGRNESGTTEPPIRYREQEDTYGIKVFSTDKGSVILAPQKDHITPGTTQVAPQKKEEKSSPTSSVKLSTWLSIIANSKVQENRPGVVYTKQSPRRPTVSASSTVKSQNPYVYKYARKPSPVTPENATVSTATNEPIPSVKPQKATVSIYTNRISSSSVIPNKTNVISPTLKMPHSISSLKIKPSLPQKPNEYIEPQKSSGVADNITLLKPEHTKNYLPVKNVSRPLTTNNKTTSDKLPTKATKIAAYSNNPLLLNIYDSLPVPSTFSPQNYPGHMPLNNQDSSLKRKPELVYVGGYSQVKGQKVEEEGNIDMSDHLVPQVENSHDVYSTKTKITSTFPHKEKVPSTPRPSFEEIIANVSRLAEAVSKSLMHYTESAESETATVPPVTKPQSSDSVPHSNATQNHIPTETHTVSFIIETASESTENVDEFKIISSSQENTEAAVTKNTEAAVTKNTEAAVTKSTEAAVTKHTETSVASSTEPVITRITQPAVTNNTEVVITKIKETHSTEPTTTVMSFKDIVESVNRLTDAASSLLLMSKFDVQDSDAQYEHEQGYEHEQEYEHEHRTTKRDTTSNSYPTRQPYHSIHQHNPNPVRHHDYPVTDHNYPVRGHTYPTRNHNFPVRDHNYPIRDHHTHPIRNHNHPIREPLETIPEENYPVQESSNQYPAYMNLGEYPVAMEGQASENHYEIYAQANQSLLNQYNSTNYNHTILNLTELGPSKILNIPLNFSQEGQQHPSDDANELEGEDDDSLSMFVSFLNAILTGDDMQGEPEKEERNPSQATGYSNFWQLYNQQKHLNESTKQQLSGIQFHPLYNIPLYTPRTPEEAAIYYNNLELKRLSTERPPPVSYIPISSNRPYGPIAQTTPYSAYDTSSKVYHFNHFSPTPIPNIRRNPPSRTYLIRTRPAVRISQTPSPIPLSTPQSRTTEYAVPFLPSTPSPSIQESIKAHPPYYRNEGSNQPTEAVIREENNTETYSVDEGVDNGNLSTPPFDKWQGIDYPPQFQASEEPVQYHSSPSPEEIPLHELLEIFNEEGSLTEDGVKSNVSQASSEELGPEETIIQLGDNQNNIDPNRHYFHIDQSNTHNISQQTDDGSSQEVPLTNAHGQQHGHGIDFDPHFHDHSNGYNSSSVEEVYKVKDPSVEHILTPEPLNPSYGYSPEPLNPSYGNSPEQPLHPEIEFQDVASNDPYESLDYETDTVNKHNLAEYDVEYIHPSVSETLYKTLENQSLYLEPKKSFLPEGKLNTIPEVKKVNETSSGKGGIKKSSVTNTENLAFILIGTCCGLSILCLIVVVITLKRKACCRRFSKHPELYGFWSEPGSSNSSSRNSDIRSQPVSTHKLGSWFNGRNHAAFGSNKTQGSLTLPVQLRNNMNLTMARRGAYLVDGKTGSARDLLSISSLSSRSRPLSDFSQETNPIGGDTSPGATEVTLEPDVALNIPRGLSNGDNTDSEDSLTDDSLPRSPVSGADYLGNGAKDEVIFWSSNDDRLI